MLVHACYFQLLLQLSRGDVIYQHTDGTPHDTLPVVGLTCGRVAPACLSSCSIHDQGVGVLQVEGTLDNEASQQTTSLQEW